MSIAGEIKYWVDREVLFPIEPTLSSGLIARHLYGSQEIIRLIEGPWTDIKEEYRSGKLRQDFDRFVQGKLISVALDNPYTKSKNAYLARLDRAYDEVWEIRSRAPRPGIRAFGRFAECNKLILFNWQYRENLGGPGSKEFQFEINKSKSEWRKIFPSYQPVSGNDIHDYVSEECIPA
jgi:hypothetical protein